MQEWGRSDESLYFAADVDRPHPQVLDVWRYTFGDQQMRAVTATADHWEEHITLTQSGSRLVLMSSECCSWNPGDVRTLAAELYLADAGGGNRIQLTRFNTPGAPEHTPGYRVAAVKAVWSPDWRQLAFGRQIAPLDRPNERRVTELWMMTFAGACGAL
jgi:hypothetical protein